MPNYIVIKNKIKNFNKKISVSGDKSISIRWVLFSSIASGISTARNLLMSEDVMAAINAVKKLGIKVVIKKNTCKIYGKGISGLKFDKNLTIDAKNSGTLGRLILGLLVNSNREIKLIGDSSLSRRDFKRVTDPLSKFGATFKLSKNKYLPLTIKGVDITKPIYHYEDKGSAQVKSSIILAALRTSGTTVIKAKKSRNHTEILCKHLRLPIKIKNYDKFDLIKVNKAKKIAKLNYDIPSDISSSAFFIILTALAKNSKLLIKNVNINSSRTGVVEILKMMGIKISFKNKKIYKGEPIADVLVKSPRKIKPINCPTKFNSGAIDEFLSIFLVAAKADGVSTFNDLSELNQKESPRLIWGSKILNLIGIKNIMTKNSIKIFGNPNLFVDKKIVIKGFLKDHRVFMTSVIAALSFGGNWHIHDRDSIKTSFPNFLNIINQIKNDK
jgi:3-phosphoshikimate 1-carboxyvinyltransferase